jgi:L,D-transpeptidase YcbB
MGPWNWAAPLAAPRIVIWPLGVTLFLNLCPSCRARVFAAVNSAQSHDRGDSVSMFLAWFCSLSRSARTGILVGSLVVSLPTNCATPNFAIVVRRALAAALTSPPSTNTEIQKILVSGRLSDLRWPDFSDYLVHLENFYKPSGYGLAWIRGTQATPQAQAVIEALEQADSKGLRSEDYNGNRWDTQLGQLGQPDTAARFDVALTICTMRYISDLRIGRVNPRHFKFGINVEHKKYDLARFVRDRLANGDDVKAALQEVEPPFPGYKRMQAALENYLKRLHEDDGEKLPEITKAVDIGMEYSGVPRLTRLLRLLGDLPPSRDVPSGNTYQGALVDGVKNFQSRHGLAPDGRLGRQTLKQLNIPLIDRVEQLRLTLERWRWVPDEFPQPPVVVNIPEFRLRAYDTRGGIVLSTNVIVGKAYRHETPVFEDEMQYVVFRPYWNVPPGIQRSEIVPAIQRDRDYVAKNNYEVVTRNGQVATSGAISEDVLQQLRAGKLALRQKPGPTNALGLVKLIFPNKHNVYLHSTPSPQLFSQSRRDFSHGCIRVEKADELAAWALAANNKAWTLEKVRAAMEDQKDEDVQVNLAKPIPVLILYATVIVDQNGVTHFFEDIYGYDAELEKVLAKGYPYPS